MKNNDDFYIGWETKAPLRLASHTRRWVCLLVVAGILAGFGFAFSQRTIGTSVFQWGNVREFTGVFRREPVPRLIVARPGLTGETNAFSSYYLVKPFKFGLTQATVNRFDGAAVRLRGTLIHRSGETMIEALEESIVPLVANVSSNNAPNESMVGLGRQTLVGEIVDSKCFLGVMNPGRFTPHRACAIRCISGGCPPLFVVSGRDGNAVSYLLVSPEGKPLNHQILEFVAEPLEISGEVFQEGELRVLRADPASFRRVEK
jgi:hypothetical protein